MEAVPSSLISLDESDPYAALLAYTNAGSCILDVGDDLLEGLFTMRLLVLVSSTEFAVSDVIESLIGAS